MSYEIFTRGCDDAINIRYINYHLGDCNSRTIIEIISSVGDEC